MRIRLLITSPCREREKSSDMGDVDQGQGGNGGRKRGKKAGFDSSPSVFGVRRAIRSWIL